MAAFHWQNGLAKSAMETVEDRAQVEQIMEPAEVMWCGAVGRRRTAAIATFVPVGPFFAGMKERLPSGRLISKSTTPRRRMLLITVNCRPSKAWRSRRIVTVVGI